MWRAEMASFIVIILWWWMIQISIYRSKVTVFARHLSESSIADAISTSRKIFVPLPPEVWCQTSIVNTRCGPAAMHGRTFPFLSPVDYVFVPRPETSRKKNCPPENLGDNRGTIMKTLNRIFLITNILSYSSISCIGKWKMKRYETPWKAMKRSILQTEANRPA